MKDNNIIPFYCICWDFNQRKVEYYNIMEDLINEYSKLPKNKKPNNDEEIKEFILSHSLYRWWSKCEYECIVTAWPYIDWLSNVDEWKKNFDLSKVLYNVIEKEKQQLNNFIKIDIYQQVKQNINSILIIFKQNISKKEN